MLSRSLSTSILVLAVWVGETAPLLAVHRFSSSGAASIAPRLLAQANGEPDPPPAATPPPEAIDASIDAASEEESPEAQRKKFDEAIKDTERLEGLFVLHRNQEKGKLYLELSPAQYNRNFLCAMTLESGIGEMGLFSGLSIGEFIFQFRRVNDKVHFVVPNVFFRSQPGDPSERSARRSFSDSVLYALPIEATHPDRNTVLLDLSGLFLAENDLPNISQIINLWLGASLNTNTSYFGNLEAFPSNVELETFYGFSGASDGFFMLESLPDSRAFQLSVRYSLSQLPENNGYRPRLADNRVGYFLTAYMDLTDPSQPDPFTRYINRWHLEKQDPNAELSPPKEPIVFWIENTVPYEYRDAIREGVLMWNRAFEQAGFLNAIEVRQMPDDADWDPADIRYNTIRWSNSLNPWFAGVGPSRVNPLTGQILDADILLDASVAQLIRREYSVFFERATASLPSSPEARQAYLSPITGDPNWCNPDLPAPTAMGQTAMGQTAMGRSLPWLSDAHTGMHACFQWASGQQFALGGIALGLMHNVLPGDDRMKEYTEQYLRFLTAHEVGHTLGLRHNFHGSTLLSPEELHNLELTRTVGMVSSVMDYVPVNLAPPGTEQGDFYPMVVGPYDEWAIAYGYRPIDAITPLRERRDLEAIAQRASDPALSYSPDEDTYGTLDPEANIFDLSSDPLQYARWQVETIHHLWDRLDKRFPLTGESYSELRLMFDMLLSNYFRQSLIATKYIGGQSFNRSHRGDPNGKLPFEPIPVEKQREALAFLRENVFDDRAFDFPPEFLNKLAPDRWLHQGNYSTILFGRLDYPIRDRIFFLQAISLYTLMDGERLERLLDLELKTSPGEALTLPELFDTLQQSIWTEVVGDEGDRSLRISNLRRSLQAEHLEILVRMVRGEYYAPEDARTIAWYELNRLEEAIDRHLDRDRRQMDTYTIAHLQKARDRIQQALESQIQ